MEAIQGSSLKDEANNTTDIRAEVVITKLHKTEVSKAKIVLAIDNLYFFTVSLPEIKTAKKSFFEFIDITRARF